MTNEEKFKAKSKLFRSYFQLSEDDIDLLLPNISQKYKGIESEKNIVSLELAEAYPLIYGMDYFEFKKDMTPFPLVADLPKRTINFIQRRQRAAKNDLGEKALKNMASYIIFILHDLEVGATFTDSDILKCLPAPLNQEASIIWGKGLLQGLTRKSRQDRVTVDENGEKKTEIVYRLNRDVDKYLVEKAKRKLEREF